MQGRVPQRISAGGNGCREDRLRILRLEPRKGEKETIVTRGFVEFDRGGIGVKRRRGKRREWGEG